MWPPRAKHAHAACALGHGDAFFVPVCSFLGFDPAGVLSPSSARRRFGGYFCTFLRRIRRRSGRTLKHAFSPSLSSEHGWKSHSCTQRSREALGGAVRHRQQRAVAVRRSSARGRRVPLLKKPHTPPPRAARRKTDPAPGGRPQGAADSGGPVPRRAVSDARRTVSGKHGEAPQRRRGRRRR